MLSHFNSVIKIQFTRNILLLDLLEYTKEATRQLHQAHATVNVTCLSADNTPN